MFCSKCGSKVADEEKFCAKCGASILFEKSNVNDTKLSGSTAKKEGGALGTVLKIFGALLIVGILLLGWLDSGSLEKNTDALINFESGNTQQAIIQLKDATEDALLDSTKLVTLTNLAYVYTSDGLDFEALKTFKEALVYAEGDSFDYYLIAGEIALHEGEPSNALLNYNQAYQMNPEDFQINNALSSFYLDLSGQSPYHVDYPKALGHAEKARETVGPEAEKTATENLAIAHFFNDNYEQTVSLLSPFVAYGDPYVSFWIGLAYAAQGDDVNGRYYLQNAVDAGVGAEPDVMEYLNSFE